MLVKKMFAAQKDVLTFKKKNTMIRLYVENNNICLLNSSCN